MKFVIVLRDFLVGFEVFMIIYIFFYCIEAYMLKFSHVCT